MQTYFRYILTVILAVAALNLRAQTLGDPVLFEDFGRAASVYQTSGGALSPGVTDLTPGGSRCPPDGSYSLVTSTDNCFGNTWLTVNIDHSSTDAFGFMMLINAFKDPATFYTQKIPADIMCSGSRYEFSVYVTNVLRPTDNANFVKPNIRFIVTKTDGTVIDNSYTTGDIAETSFADWKKYFVRFVAPTDGQGIVIKLLNENPGSLGNDFAMDDIAVSPFGERVDAGFGTATGGTEKTICVGQGATSYHFEASAGSYVSPHYQWQKKLDDGAWTNIPGATASNLDVTVPDTKGKYQYRVGVLGGANTSLTCQIFSAPLVVMRNALPVYSLPPSITVCEGETLQLTADRGTEYEWTGPNGYHSTDQSPLVANDATQANAGDYTVLITRDGCSITSTTKVIVAPPLTVTVNDRRPKVCEGEPYQIVATGGTTYKWSPSFGLSRDDIANPVVTPTQSMEYQVTISNGGCSKIETVTLDVIKRPIVSAGRDPTMQEGEPIKLEGKIDGDYDRFYWTPTTGMADPESLTPTIDPSENITYTLHVDQGNDCGSLSDEVSVRVYKKLGIPTAFTPNSDGVNDTWVIDKLNTYPGNTVTIYTRDGKEVYRMRDFAKPWNGVYNGKQLPAGTYYYVIDLNNELPKRSGWVYLLQ